MKVLFLDNDGVICLSNNWGSRHKKQLKWGGRKLSITTREMPVEYRFDDFDKKSIKILNEIIIETDVEIVVSSDWRNWASTEELGEYFTQQGIIKKPIGCTKFLQQCESPGDDFPWLRSWDLEQTRSVEIKQWLKDNPYITHWVAVDDLNMGKSGKQYTMDFNHEWGLDNFVLTPKSNEGIKQSGIKEKILTFLKG